MFLRMRSVLPSVVAGDLHWPVSLPQHAVTGTCLRDELRCLRGSLDRRDTGGEGTAASFWWPCGYLVFVPRAECLQGIVFFSTEDVLDKFLCLGVPG